MGDKKLLPTVVPRDGGYERICSCGPRAWSVYAALCSKGANREMGWSGSVRQLHRIIPDISRETVRRTLKALKEARIIVTAKDDPWTKYRIFWREGGGHLMGQGGHVEGQSGHVEGQSGHLMWKGGHVEGQSGHVEGHSSEGEVKKENLKGGLGPSSSRGPAPRPDEAERARVLKEQIRQIQAMEES